MKLSHIKNELNKDSKLAICIATCNRSFGLDNLLSSINDIKFKKSVMPKIRLLIVDNDHNKSALHIVEKWKNRFPFQINYANEQKRGIPFARNLLVKLSESDDFIVFVDDDECVKPIWLDELLYVYNNYDADGVMGPILPIYRQKPPEWLIKGKFHFSDRYATGALINFINTGNLLLNRRFLDKYRNSPFEERMAFTGGTDSLLGMKLRNDGVKIVWADDAIVEEIIPKERAKIKWLLQRRFRMGNTDPIAFKYERIRFASCICIYKSLKIFSIGLIKIFFSIFEGEASFAKGLGYCCQGIGIIYGLLGFQFKEYNLK